MAPRPDRQNQEERHDRRRRTGTFHRPYGPAHRGGSGIGAATARRLAAEGASVLVTDVDAEAAQRVAEDIRTGAGGHGTGPST